MYFSRITLGKAGFLYNLDVVYSDPVLWLDEVDPICRSVLLEGLSVCLH